MSLPALQNPAPSFTESRRIEDFWEANYERLLAAYPEQWVAVREGDVVAAHADLAMLVYRLRDLGLDARDDVAIEFVTAEAGSLIL